MVARVGMKVYASTEIAVCHISWMPLPIECLQGIGEHEAAVSNPKPLSFPESCIRTQRLSETYSLHSL